MIQKHKEAEKESSSNSGSIKEKLEQIKAMTPVAQEESQFRQVMLKILAQSCGCGGGGDDYVDIMRIVPTDSPLQDGDIVTNYEDADEIW